MKVLLNQLADESCADVIRDEVGNIIGWTFSLSSLQEFAEKLSIEQPSAGQSSSLPVGFVKTIGGYPDESAHTVAWVVPYSALQDGDRLYLRPPTKSNEVPLTDEEICKLAFAIDGEGQDIINFARAIEKALGVE